MHSNCWNHHPGGAAQAKGGNGASHFDDADHDEEVATTEDVLEAERDDYDDDCTSYETLSFVEFDDDDNNVEQARVAP